jgi:hypothetical protein
MSSISHLKLNRIPDETSPRPPSAEEAQEAVSEASEALLGWVVRCADKKEDVAYRDVENEVRERLFTLGRALVVLFLVLREEWVVDKLPAAGRLQVDGRQFLRRPRIARNLSTMFGTIRYWRTYMRQVGNEEPGQGFHPLDASLGLQSDRFSWNVLSKAAWFATQMSFADARRALGHFVPNTPSTEVIEKAVLGLGSMADSWLRERPAPHNDGEVLVIMFDGKGIPTVTEQELRRRRGPRRRGEPERSPRHRGRSRRRRYPKKKRPKKGDKSKNAKVATTVVMYTLRRRGTRRLEGPVNKWVYSSFAPKRHAFHVARQWAQTRGFTQESGKLVQVVTDGDNDLADLSADYFPQAEHTIDVWHVVEYLYQAAGAIFTEGSESAEPWVDEQKDCLFEGEVGSVVRRMKRRLSLISKTGPGNKGRRERLLNALRYIEKRQHKMDYGSLRRRDLEISTGPIEGAIKHIIGRRQDHGGMRWIKERAEAVLKLRCIAVTDDWHDFERTIHDIMHTGSIMLGRRFRIQADHPDPLPHLREAA